MDRRSFLTGIAAAFVAAQLPVALVEAADGMTIMVPRIIHWIRIVMYVDTTDQKTVDRASRPQGILSKPT